MTRLRRFVSLSPFHPFHELSVIKCVSEIAVEPHLSHFRYRSGNAMSQQHEKPPLLAWWGIFPGLAFAAVAVYFGWPLAMADTHSFSFAVGNIVGRIMAGVLISLLIAWLAYRFGSRSQTTATCAFAVMLGLFCGRDQESTCAFREIKTVNPSRRCPLRARSESFSSIFRPVGSESDLPRGKQGHD